MLSINIFVKQTEYLKFVDGLANKVEELFKNNCRTFINQLRVLESKVFLGPFKCNDVQSVFTFNSQIFKVQTKDVKKFIKEIDKTVQLVVKVFNPNVIITIT